MLIFSAMKKPIITSVLAMFFAVSSYAANTATLSWLLINSYPEFAAKGAASGAVFCGITSAGLNPASIAEMENVEFGVMHNNWRQGITAEKLSVGKVFDAGNFAIELVYNNMGSVPVLLADQYGNPVITTDIANLSAWGASIIYAKKIKDFSLGMALKVFGEDLSGGATYTGCADVGFIYKGFLSDKINLGISLLNISAGSSDFYTPIDLKAALVYTYLHGGSPVIDVFAGCDYLIKESYLTGQAGFDYYLFDTLTLRGGISIDRDANLSFSAGAGLKIEGMTMAYSYEPDGNLGDSHKVSLNAVFGKSPAASDEEGDGEDLSDKGTFVNYMESGDYYYNSKQYRKAVKYYEYINLLYWKDLEDKGDKAKSTFFQKLGICYYNMKDSKRAAQYFDRALFFDKENEILKHWIKSLK
jgi:hypothetical protein